jgi:hypothetical protein
VSGIVIAGPTLRNGVAKPVSVYTIDWPSVPIVASAPRPERLIVPGPTNSSFHRFSSLPSEYCRLSDGRTFVPTSMSSPTASLSVYATTPASTSTFPTAGPVGLPDPYFEITL